MKDFKLFAISLGEIILGLINFVFGLIVIGLSIRFIFRLLGANPFSDAVQFIYNSTSPLLDPFRGIFVPDAISPDAVIEYSSLIAIIIYLLIAWLITILVSNFEEWINKVDKR